MKKLVLETTSPFQGLPELVAFNEGLFEQEGLAIEWADRDEAGVKAADTSLTDPKGADPFGSHGTLFEQGKADMYNACEWGNYCRVGATGIGSRPSWFARILRFTRRSNSLAAPSGFRSMPERTISRCICWKASCRAHRSMCAARRTARATASTS
jgi:hypothetical protein